MPATDTDRGIHGQLAAGGIAPVKTTEQDWAGVTEALGRSGTLSGETVYRVSFPRKDLNVTSQGVPIKAGFALGSYTVMARYPDSKTVMPDATSGTAMLRLASQQARINAARRQPGELSQTLALAGTASLERTPDEPGTFGFDAGHAALFASDAHGVFDGTEHLNAAVDWARIALDEFTADTSPKAMYIAAARFNLARAHLARGELDAVGEHLAPVLRSTHAEYRTVPIIGRAHSLRIMLSQRTDLASSTLATLSDDLAEFVAHPAPTPPGLELGTPSGHAYMRWTSCMSLRCRVSFLA